RGEGDARRAGGQGRALDPLRVRRAGRAALLRRRRGRARRGPREVQDDGREAWHLRADQAEAGRLATRPFTPHRACLRSRALTPRAKQGRWRVHYLVADAHTARELGPLGRLSGTARAVACDGARLGPAPLVLRRPDGAQDGNLLRVEPLDEERRGEPDGVLR